MYYKIPKLTNFSNNIYSQFGEDGIIEKIFSIINAKSKLCVEFGAWDGIYLSNTARLWKHQNWKAILIEVDKERIEQVKHENVTTICAKVGYDNNKDSLDFILKQNNITDRLDFLSIDIDGDDWLILQNLQCRPRVICIEYNPTIPFWIDCVQKPGEQFGASLAAMVRLAKEKGYYLIATTDTNAFFINEEEKYLFEDYNTNYSEIACRNHYISIITDFAGKYKIIGTQPYGVKEPIDENTIVFGKEVK